MFEKLFRKRAAREKWDAGLAWFRLRYLEPEGPTRCLNLLSRPEACGRVALYYRPGEAVSQLYLGVPKTHERLLQRMAADFSISLKPMPPDVAVPAAQPMAAVPVSDEAEGNLPWDRLFMAHIANEFAFLSLIEGENKGGSYLPRPPSTNAERGPARWRLPDSPPAGMTLRPSWNGQQPPAHLVASGPDRRRWLLGRSLTGLPLHTSGRINIYGRQEAVADWLVHQVTQMVAADHANLVVIDGASLAHGFNPLAASPGETEAETVERWRHWFQGMNVHPQGIRLLAQARQGGAEDIASLRKWLKQVERQGQCGASAAGSMQAVSSLGMALNRLTASQSLRQWLEWPANRFDVLPEGALLFACRGTGWDRQQLLRAVLLGVLPVAGARLIVHGFPWQAVDLVDLARHERIVVGNGPLLSDSTVVLTECHAGGVASLATRFLNGNKQLQENLELLGRSEGIVVADNLFFFATWNNSSG